jgi:hypothetical protein
MKLVIGVCALLAHFFPGHLHITTEWNQTDDIFGITVLECEESGFPAEDGGLESNRKGLHANADKFGGEEVTQLVNEDEEADTEDGQQ